jgi:PPOX class probable F420-dependent enzyme
VWRDRRLSLTVTIPEAVRAFLDEPRFAVLATINPDGTPQQTVMWYALRGNTIIMNTAAGRVKDDNIRRDNRVSVCWEDGYRYVSIDGTVTLDEDLDTARTDIFALARRYNPDAIEADYPAFRTQQRVTWKIAIDRLVTNGF